MGARSSLWLEVNDHAAVCRSPWIIIRDFNAFFSPEHRTWGTEVFEEEVVLG